MDTSVLILATLLFALCVGVVAYKFGNMQERIRSLENNYGHTKTARENKTQNESELFTVSPLFQSLMETDTALENAFRKHQLTLAAFDKYRRFKIHLTNGGDPDAPESMWLNPNNKSGGKK